MALGDGHAPRAHPTPGCRWVARERLVMGPGYIIEPGEPFEPLLFSMTDLQAELWWSSAIIDVAPPAESADLASEPPSAPPAVPAAPAAPAEAAPSAATSPKAAKRK